MKPLLSVLVPGIRPENWPRLYASCVESLGGSLYFEMICVGPQNSDDQRLLASQNYFFRQDFGCPTRAQQIALREAEGQYVTWAADDGIFLPDRLTQAINKYEELKYPSHAFVLTCKYHEGSAENMDEDWYYKVATAPAQNTPFIPKDYYILNVGIVDRHDLLRMGGWDCRFQVAVMAYHDLAVRMQRAGFEFRLHKEPIYRCSHMPGESGDHGPIHRQQTQSDEPLFRQIYSDASCLSRMVVELDNWTQSEPVWKRRFS